VCYLPFIICPITSLPQLVLCLERLILALRGAFSVGNEPCKGARVV
jgi:hypothetical protein